MNSKRVFFVMLALVGLMVAAAGMVTYSGQKMLVKEGDKLVSLKQEKQVIDGRSKALIKAKRDIVTYEELELLARSVVPRDKDQAKTVVDIVEIAKDAGVDNIINISFPESLLGELQTGKGAKKNQVVDPNLTQLTPLDSPKGVYGMEIRIETDAEEPRPYRSLVRFLSRLEKNRRTAQVTDIQINPDKDNRNNISFTLTLTTYVKP